MAASCSSVASATRKKTDIWLIGQPAEKLPELVLPTSGDTLKTYFYHHKILQKTVSESLNATTEDLLEIWAKARIPTALKVNIVSKMRGEVDEYNLLKKNKGRHSATQISRENKFSDHMKELFDIAHKEAGTLIRIEEDKIFLSDQRKHRKMMMAGVDKELADREDRSRHRRIQEEQRKIREAERNLLVSSVSSLEDTAADIGDEPSDREEERDEDYEIEIPLHYHRRMSAEESVSSSKKPHLLHNVLDSPDVASTLDRINLSDTKFTILAAVIAKANGENLEVCSFSRSTVYRKRRAHRSSTEAHVRQQFLATHRPPLIVHWDGKLMRDSTNKENPKSTTDRIAVCITGQNVDKILGIAKIQSGTGQAQTNATVQLLRLWEVTDDIVGMCFDTTATNTGQNSGACNLLEQELGKNLLHLACRHHVHELIIGGVFSALFGPSRSPNIPLFERFQKYWPNINKECFKLLDLDSADTKLAAPYIQQLKSDAIEFLQAFLILKDEYMPRDDYKEVAELCLLVLGVSPVSDSCYHFRLPGAYHMARWMAKIIYCFKIFLFREQFSLAAKENKNLTKFCMFASLIYVKAWLSCPLASDAPVNDMLLFKQIEQYANVSKTVSDAAFNKFKRHLWYIGSELISLSLFSDKLSVADKKKMVEAMKQCGQTRQVWSIRGIKPDVTDGLQHQELWELVNESTISALHCLQVDVEFLLNIDPEMWAEHPTYQSAKTIVSSLKVVNDTAERTISLMSDFNESITKDEEQMQHLIQVVEDNRKRIPDASKKTLTDYVPLDKH